MLEEITQTLREYKRNPSLTLTLDTSFADLNLDSLETVELVMKIEDKTGMSIQMDGDINTIGDLLAAIENSQ